MAYNHIWLSTLKSYLGEDPEYTVQDGRMSFCIQSASRTVENLLGCELSYGTYTEIHSTRENFNVGFDLFGMSHYGYELYSKYTFYSLKNYPIDTTAPITITYSPFPPDHTYNLSLTTDQYYLNPNDGRLFLNVITCRGMNNLSVTYSAGYNAEADPNNSDDLSLQPNLPADMVQATLFQAMHLYEKQKSSNINMSSPVNTGKGARQSYVNKAAISPETMAIIAMNRRPKIMVI